MKKGVYPGSFDPITIGHIDIIKRAALLVDQLHVLVADNVYKHHSFTVAERIKMLEFSLKEIKNIVISSSSDLVIRYAKENGISTIYRGLRNIDDFENEYSLYQFNHNLDETIETVLLFPASKNNFVSSSGIKELVYHNADISKYVPAEIIEIINEKLKKISK